MKRSLFLVFFCLLVATGMVWLGDSGLVFGIGQSCEKNDDCPKKEDYPPGAKPLKDEICCPIDRPQGVLGICALDCGQVITPFSKHKTLKDFLEDIANYIFYLGITIAPLMILVGAFVFLISAGDTGKTKLGKDIIKWSLVGLIIVLLSKAMFSILSNIFGG